MEFTYNGMVRYGFGFANPNHAALLITILVVLTWTIRLEGRNRLLKYLLFAFELLLYTALFYTYSRTGILALASSAMLFWGARYFILKPKQIEAFQGKYLLQYAFYILAILVVFFYSGISNRITNSFILNDRSISNRFDVWQGGLNMLIDMPLGTGTGLSGRIYTLFYLPANSSLGYRTLINSFLTFWVEQGVAVSAILLFGAQLIIVVASELLRKPELKLVHKKIIICCLSIVFAGAICGMLSTCFDISLKLDSINNILQYLTFMLWLGSFAVVIIIGINHHKILSLKKLFNRVGISFLSLIVLALFVCSLVPDDKVKINSLNTGVITIGNEQNNPKVLIVPDFTSSLKDQLYTMKKHFKTKSLSIVISENINMGNIINNQPFNAISLYGASCSMVNMLAKSDVKIFLFCPKTFEIVDNSKKKYIAKIYLKHYDENGNNYIWKNYLANRKKVVYIK